MPHQKNELSSKGWFSNFKSRFQPSRPPERKDEVAVIRAALSVLIRKVEKLMADFARLDSAIVGLIADNVVQKDEIAALGNTVAGLNARIAELEAANAAVQGEIDKRAATIEDARGGSMGGIS
jgi:hypothetical protein